MVPWTSAASRRLEVGRELGDVQALRGGGVGGQHAHAAGVGEDREPPTGRQRLLGEQHRGAGEVLGVAAADHAGLGEQRVDSDARATRRPRCARPRARLPPADRPPTTASSGLRSAKRRANRANLAALPNDSR